MKQWGLTLLVIAFSLIAGTGLAIYLLNREEANTQGAHSNMKPTISTVAQKDRFVWGVQGGAYMLNQKVDTYHSENVNLQIEKTKELGAGLIRANLEISKDYKPFTISYADKDNDDFVNRVTEQNLDLLLVLDPDIPGSIGIADYYQEGYKLGSHAAGRYTGKVKYYQLANEVSGTIVKPENYKGETFKGENNIEYSKERYDATLAWIKGMAAGVRANDHDAKLLVSGHWILYDIIGKLISDGADFDIIGWAWYSSDGEDITNREYNYGQHFNLAEKLSSYKKDLWIVEANRSGGSYGDNGEQDQAQFFTKTLSNLYSSKYFKGFIEFTLFDNRLAEKPQDGHFGLTEVEFVNGKNKVRRDKPAFGAYQTFIKTHPQLPTL